ncbi:MAG: protein-L-isoaspartate O-methyltransferase [Undibacterium sp.]|uniref:protein-L-isoaspartate O-methyltransferase family protein n=1 Tax=Undibacterium sp. TaxID=1914977 RepID=UPI002726D70E|nr:protein-L-isoaspartate O-methyltransferase [Undibacterium sp.]MDO8652843.1 protein-L-isoaspartate O-methyltransferase [Undibacterium sp.]
MNIEQARFNMIEQQIRPWNVLAQDVLDMLMVVKRENYFPENQKSLAFFDTELPLADGVYALSPKLEARIVQEVAVKKHETVLLVGAGTGYLAALLAYKARHVTVMETIPEIKALAEKNLSQNGITNVDVVWGDALQGKHAATFDVIVVSGSLETIPDDLQKQLAVNGRMFVIIGKAPVMTAQIITRESELFFNTKQLFETSVPRLSQAVPVSTFSF